MSEENGKKKSWLIKLVSNKWFGITVTVLGILAFISDVEIQTLAVVLVLQ
ncbi:MAG: hypothetical protein ACRCY4_01585 [Brevinema sp.]